jgi:acylphosphatase
MIELQAIVTGKVQGVMYRAYIQEAATNLELVGYVENQPDGTVLVVAQGNPDVLKEFVEYLYEGSSLSQVSSVAVDWGSVSKTYFEFSVLH